jgi:hypothetical protein
MGPDGSIGPYWDHPGLGDVRWTFDIMCRALSATEKRPPPHRPRPMGVPEEGGDEAPNPYIYHTNTVPPPLGASAQGCEQRLGR